MKSPESVAGGACFRGFGAARSGWAAFGARLGIRF